MFVLQMSYLELPEKLPDGAITKDRSRLFARLE
jgi:hypothetical protein